MERELEEGCPQNGEPATEGRGRLRLFLPVLQMCALLWIVSPFYRTLLLLLSVLTRLLSWKGAEVEVKGVGEPCCHSPPFIGAADDSFSGARSVCYVDSDRLRQPCRVDEESTDVVAKTFVATSSGERSCHRAQLNCSYVRYSAAQWCVCVCLATTTFFTL